MKKYVTLSLETHLFFGRIMKEHALFLQASFPEKEKDFRQRADHFREEFEDGLRRAVQLADGVVSEALLASGEVVTEYTVKAECQTSKLIGISIDTQITEAEERLRSDCSNNLNREMIQAVRRLNHQMARALNGLIALKEEILRQVTGCRLFTTNYPLLIEHILREAKLYRQVINELEHKGRISPAGIREMEMFWNQIMMEHAQFIRGLLDPTECDLIRTADEFVEDYKHLLEEARDRDLCIMDELTAKALHTTEKYQRFKTAGTEGITGCEIRSIILPLLADHVLREANHYLRILEDVEKSKDC